MPSVWSVGWGVKVADYASLIRPTGLLPGLVLQAPVAHARRDRRNNNTCGAYDSVNGVRRREMPIPAAAQELAAQKGFKLRERALAGDFQLIELSTGLPEINPADNSLSFTINEVIAFLAPLRDRNRGPRG